MKARTIISVAASMMVLGAVAAPIASAHVENMGEYSSSRSCFADARSNNDLGFPGAFLCEINDDGSYTQIYWSM